MEKFFEVGKTYKLINNMACDFVEYYIFANRQIFNKIDYNPFLVDQILSNSVRVKIDEAFFELEFNPEDTDWQYFEEVPTEKNVSDSLRYLVTYTEEHPNVVMCTTLFSKEQATSVALMLALETGNSFYDITEVKNV